MLTIFSSSKTADNALNMIKMMVPVSERVENVVGKVENASNQSNPAP